MLIMLFASASARAECSHASYEALRPPKYPAAAAAAHMEGRVLVSIIVHADGRATDAFVRRSSGHDELDLAALDAVSSWRYKPRNCNGKPAAASSSASPSTSTPKVPTPASFPRVDPETQKGRDGVRRKVLTEELASEEKLLTESRTAYADGAAPPPAGQSA